MATAAKGIDSFLARVNGVPGQMPTRHRIADSNFVAIQPAE
jgi:hypothetical protein